MVSVIVGVLVAIMLLSSTVFTVKSISVEYQTTLNYITEKDFDGIIEDGAFEYGKNIFFVRFDENIRKIEKANPYVKVNNIERKFPSYACVNISERMPVVQMEAGRGKYILDSEGKIVNIVSTFNDYILVKGENDLPHLRINNVEGVNLKLDNYETGDFVLNEKLTFWLDAFYRGAVRSSATDESSAISCISIIESIEIDYDKEIESIRFHLIYKNYSYEENFEIHPLESTISGEKDLVDSVYKIISAVRAVGDKYKNINCINGEIFYGEKTN